MQAQQLNMGERGLRSIPTKQDALLLERVEKFEKNKYYNSTIAWTSLSLSSFFRPEPSKKESPLKQLQHTLEIRGSSTVCSLTEACVLLVCDPILSFPT